MQNTKLVTLLKTFSEKEMKDFEKFIISPYFSKGRNLRPLYSILKKHHPVYSSLHFGHEKIYSKLFPGRRYDEKKSAHSIHVMFSELAVMAEKFLAIEHLQKQNDGYELYNLLSDELLNRNLNTYSHKHLIKNIDRIQKTESLRSYFIGMTELVGNIQSLMIEKDDQLKAYDYNKQIVLYLYGLMLLGMKKLVSDYIVMASNYEMNPQSKRLLEMSILSFDADTFEKECYDDGNGTKQYIMTQYYLIKSHLNNKDENSLKTAFEIFRKHNTNFMWTFKWGLLISLLNICVIRSNESADNFNKYSLFGNEVVDLAIENNILCISGNGFMTTSTYWQFFHFKAVFLTGEELKSFIDMLLEKTGKNERQFLYDYSYAWLNFKNRNYEKTLEHLAKLHTTSMIRKKNIIVFKILSLYSLGYIEEVIYNLDSYEHHSYNNPQLSQDSKNKTAAFIKIIRTLIKYRTRPGIEYELDINKISKDTKLYYFDNWLKEEVEKIKKSR